MRIAFVLPGLHRVVRGAEVAFESIASELAKLPDCHVTLIGSGKERDHEAYAFERVGCISREHFERWPSLPCLRNEYMYEELTFVPGLLWRYRPLNYDVTVTCSYPYTNWILRRRSKGKRPTHVYVTQNGDWPAQTNNREFRYFNCEGLVCTNPQYFERNQSKWRSCLIPNGVDPNQFTPGSVDRQALGLPTDKPIVLIVSALILSKHVLEAIACVAQISGLYLVIAGDGPLRKQVQERGVQLMGDQFKHVVLPREQMPDLYRAADVFLHMSQDEPFGNVYVEALATGLPIVTHDRYVTQWTLEDQAILVNTNGKEEVIGGIKEALALGGEEHITLRRALVEKRFAWSSIAKQYRNFFEEVCGA